MVLTHRGRLSSIHAMLSTQDTGIKCLTVYSDMILQFVIKRMLKSSAKNEIRKTSRVGFIKQHKTLFQQCFCKKLEAANSLKIIFFSEMLCFISIGIFQIRSLVSQKSAYFTGFFFNF